MLLCCTVLALARQIGVLHERIAPVGALITDDGPAVGQMVPRFEMRTVGGLQASVGGPAPDALRLLLFVAHDCPVCKRIVPLAQRVARAEARRDPVTLVLIGDDDPVPLRAMRDRFGVPDSNFLLGAAPGIALHIGRLPYGVLLDSGSVIRAKGLVNTREHLESLLAAHETGHPSVQSFLRRHANAGETSDAA